MELPNYFFADLPPEATLSAAMLQEACQALKRNREQYLAPRTTRSMIALLSGVAQNWLEPTDRFRDLALAEGPGHTGFSRQTLAKGLDAFFKTLTPEGFAALLEQDLGHPRRLEEMSATADEQKAGRAALATAPHLLVHITAGNLPIPALMSIVLGVLLRSAQFVKCARGASWVPRLFAHSLYEADRKLGACLEIAEWHGGAGELEHALFAEADCVTATGTDETINHIARRLGPRTRLVPYGPRVSFAYITSDALTGGQLRRVVQRATDDVAAWNQLGCLSPHVLYVQDGGPVTPEKFAELLAEELAQREQTEPRGDLPAASAATIASRRAIYELRAAHSPDTRHWCSLGSTAWTVVYEAEPRFQLSCLNRFIYVKGIKDLTEALRQADAVRGQVSTVGLAASEHESATLAEQLARWGATRVCPLGQMQAPPLLWRHDGRPALGDLVTWTDWERGGFDSTKGPA
jgi:hypothetical protein